MSQPNDPFQVPDEPQRKSGHADTPGGEQSQPGAQHPFNAGSTGAPQGTPMPPYSGGYMAGPPPAQNLPQGMAIASLVLGIVGVVLTWFLIVPSILAVIFGHIGLAKANRGEGGGKGMAIAGLVLGYIVLGILVLIIVVTGGFLLATG